MKRKAATAHEAETPSGRQGQKTLSRRVSAHLLVIAGFVLLFVAGAMLAYRQYAYYQQDKVNEDLASHVTVDTTSSESSPVIVDWDSLKAIDPDIVGWLYVPGTNINYAVYQGSDNEYYLRHNAEGTWTVGGQLFLDYENSSPGLIDSQSIIYGHHLQNGTMFEQIAQMDQQETFNRQDTIWYLTESKAYQLTPLFMYDTDSDDLTARTFTFSSEDEFHTYLAARLNRAVTRCDGADKIIEGISHVLTLSTCVYYDTYAEGHGRGLVVCAPLEEVRSALSISSA